VLVYLIMISDAQYHEPKIYTYVYLREECVVLMHYPTRRLMDGFRDRYLAIRSSRIGC